MTDTELVGDTLRGGVVEEEQGIRDKSAEQRPSFFFLQAAQQRELTDSSSEEIEMMEMLSTDRFPDCLFFTLFP